MAMNQLSACVVMYRPDWSKSSGVPASWRHDLDVNNQNIVMLPIFQWLLAMFTELGSKSQYNVMEVCQFKEEGFQTGKILLS